MKPVLGYFEGYVLNGLNVNCTSIEGEFIDK